MNLYLLLALAFGAISVEMPAVRASVILSREDGKGSQVARKQVLPLRYAQGQADRSADAPVSAVDRHETPLTGASSPRAPTTLG